MSAVVWTVCTAALLAAAGPDEEEPKYGLRGRVERALHHRQTQPQDHAAVWSQAAAEVRQISAHPEHRGHGLPAATVFSA